MSVQKIRPFLWFNYNAEAAANFYVSFFRDSKILNRMGPSGGQVGSGLEFQLEKIEIAALREAYDG